MENTNVVTFPSMAVMRQRLNEKKAKPATDEDIHVALILDACCSTAAMLNQKIREQRIRKVDAIKEMESYVETYNYVICPKENSGFAVLVLNNPEAITPEDMSEGNHTFALRLLNAQYKFHGVHMRNCLLLSDG